MKDILQTNLHCFKISLDNYDHLLPEDSIGKLIVEFQKQFGRQWSLLCQRHISEKDSKYYILYAVKGYSIVADNEQEEIIDERTIEKMRYFIYGFIRGYK